MTNTSADQDLAIRCIRIMLRPLVRFCLHTKLNLIDFIRIAKVVFVDIGEEELRKITPKINVSRLSVVTGVHRKDLKQIYDEGRIPETYSVSIPARVSSLWEQSPKYASKPGKPRVLGYEGDNNEFRDLVFDISSNLNPGTVLFELERLGLVERTPRGLRLLKAVNRFDESSKKGFDLVSRDVETLLTAVIENISDPQKVLNLHLRTEYDNVVQNKLWDLRRWVLREGRTFHKRLRTKIAGYDRDIQGETGADAGGRVTVCSFSFTTLPNEKKR